MAVGQEGLMVIKSIQNKWYRRLVRASTAYECLDNSLVAINLISRLYTSGSYNNSDKIKTSHYLHKWFTWILSDFSHDYKHKWQA